MPLARAAPRRNTRRRFLRWDQLSFGPFRGTKLWSEKYCISNIFHSSTARRSTFALRHPRRFAALRKTRAGQEQRGGVVAFTRFSAQFRRLQIMAAFCSGCRISKKYAFRLCTHRRGSRSFWPAPSGGRRALRRDSRTGRA